jgi:hypothetical protein
MQANPAGVSLVLSSFESITDHPFFERILQFFKNKLRDGASGVRHGPFPHCWRLQR